MKTKRHTRIRIAKKAIEDDDYIPKTKAEITADLKEVFIIAKAAREGKIKGRPVEELLNEL